MLLENEEIMLLLLMLAATLRLSQYAKWRKY